MKRLKQILSLSLVCVAAFSFSGCKSKTPGYIPPQQTTAPSMAPTEKPTTSPSATPTATATPKASPSPSATPAASVSVANWGGSYAKEAGSAGQISLSITNATAAAFDFVLDTKGLTLQGTAHVQSDGSVTASVGDGSLTFQKSFSEISVAEKTAPNANVSFAGTYTPF